jgi:uncharacterized protein (TIGR00255 family)
MRSMTGFGVGQAALGDGRVLLELRALNHRFLEVRVRLPNELTDQAFFMEQLARERFARGRFDLGVRLQGSALPAASFSPERARGVYQSLLALRDVLAPGTEVPLSAITALPDLVLARVEVDAESLRRVLLEAFQAAAQQLDQMREGEGDSLQRELTDRLEGCAQLLTTIAARSGSLTDVYRKKLRDRVERLLSGTAVQIDSGRLETELALLADRSDIAEELVRLSSHFEQFRQTLLLPGPIGRRLDFLLQEMSREANTIGAKSQDAPIAHLVVEMKAEIERVREQVQNVE